MTRSDALSLQLLSLVPQIMQAIRAEMRKSRGADLSVPQFRVLAYLRGKPGAAQIEVAEHLGLTSPSIVSLVDGLAAQDLVRRDAVAGDRRKVALHLSERGIQRYDAAFAAARQRLSERLQGLGEEDLELLLQALGLLRPFFQPAGSESAAPAPGAAPGRV